MNETSKDEGCWSLFRWDQLRLGQLSKRDALQGRTHLQDCPRCNAHWHALEAEREKFKSSLPPSWIKELDGSKNRSPKSQKTLAWNPARVAFSLSVLVVCFLVLWPDIVHESSFSSTSKSVVRSKGADSFGVFIKHRDQVRLARDGELVHPGDALRFFYSTRQSGFFVIANIDGLQNVSAFYPHGPQMAEVEVGGQRFLPESTVLDGTLGTEQLYGIFCQQNRLVDEVLRVLRRDNDLQELPKDCHVQRIELHKEKPFDRELNP